MVYIPKKELCTSFKRMLRLIYNVIGRPWVNEVSCRNRAGKLSQKWAGVGGWLALISHQELGEEAVAEDSRGEGESGRPIE